MEEKIENQKEIDEQKNQNKIMKQTTEKEIIILHKNYKETPFENNLRFQCELEFVQALSDVFYLKYLYDNNYFEDQRFLNYLQYLNYWRYKPYIFFIHFPVSLYILEVLNECDVKECFKNSESFNIFLNYLKLHWLFYHW